MISWSILEFSSSKRPSPGLVFTVSQWAVTTTDQMKNIKSTIWFNLPSSLLTYFILWWCPPMSRKYSYNIDSTPYFARVQLSKLKIFGHDVQSHPTELHGEIGKSVKIVFWAFIISLIRQKMLKHIALSWHTDFMERFLAVFWIIIIFNQKLINQQSVPWFA